MTAVHEDPILTPQFEAIARAVEREADGVQVELIDGRMGVRPAPDGDHNRILNWLLLLLMPLSPDLFLHLAGQGLAIGAHRKGRARPDGVVAPLDAFVGSGEWAATEPVRMVVEVTSYDSDTNRRDKVDKPIAYAQSRIPIYLLIDRDAAEVVMFSEPHGERYQEIHRHAFGRPVALANPLAITLDTAPLKDWID